MFVLLLHRFFNSFRGCLLNIAIATISVSCATRGHDFDSNLSWIQKGKTQKSEIKQKLGDPFQVGYASDQPTWTYGYYVFKLFGDSYTKELKLYWNRNGTVSNFSFSSSFPTDINADQKKAANEATTTPEAKTTEPLVN